MDVVDFYAQSLGLDSLWRVKAVLTEDNAQRVDVYLECEQSAQFLCPLCDQHRAVCDYSPLKTWRHPDTCLKTTYLHARLPIVNCSEHGKQHLHPPWGRADSPVTLAFEQLVTRLIGCYGDIKKTADYLRLEQDHVRRILRRMTEEAERVKDRPADCKGNASKASREPEIRQLSLFAQNDMSIVNFGIRAFRNLELEKAVELFQKHQSIYPKGYNITSRLAAADFLLRGFREAPAEPAERPTYLCRLWISFEDYVKSEQIGREAFAAELKGVFFARIIEEAERCGRSNTSFLDGNIPLGYIFLQAERYEDAIRSLQNCILEAPHNASIYGYLGDAYLLRGEQKVARRCYREACLIDPVGIDWRHLQDEELKELKQDLSFLYGLGPEVAMAWLPSHARINGLFERKAVRLHEGLKELVDDYLALEKALLKENSPSLRAKLFFRGMILCENQENLKFIKKIDLIQVRRIMKNANPELFAEFLESLVEGK